jgi:hypothetical protein
MMCANGASPVTELQDRALRKTFYLVQTDVPAKHVIALQNYINSLSEEELTCYINIAQRLYDRKTLGSSWKVSTNAIKLCVKIAALGVKTFPFVEKIATKGWDTSGGTYCFSMPILTNDLTNCSIYSFNNVDILAKSKTKIDVYYNEHTRLQEVDIKSCQ